jgi:hypothetical protein
MNSLGRGILAFPAFVGQVLADNDVENYPHSVISEHGHWVGVLWLIIGGLILAAAVIGPIVRDNLPEEEITPQSHDEPPGSSHQHGDEGTEP